MARWLPAMTRLLVACIVTLALAVPASAATRYDPALRFRTITTPHFVIYFHQGEERLAQRFAPIAEDVYRQLTAKLAALPSGRTHVILVDQNDVPNGWATPLPYDTIELTVAPPAARSVIGNVDDWLRLVFAHEYTHILHLDQSRGFGAVAHAVFGRSPLAFANLFLPSWQTEGLATYEESATTGRGRVNAGDFHLFVSQAAREHRAMTLDRASSDNDDWPAGNTPYAYGAFFTQFLADRYGAEKLGELSRRTAGRFYFLSTAAFTKTFGKSLGELWKDFERAEASAPDGDRAAPGRRLTHQGFVAAGPHFVETPDGRRQILYSSQTADDFPSLMSVDLEGRTRRLASRYFGESITSSGGAAVFDQVDLGRSVALESDLYALDLRSGAVRRLTHRARFVDPAISPDGRALACVSLRAGERHLVVFDLPPGAWPANTRLIRIALAATPRIDLVEPGLEYAWPRWSPDGRVLAAERRLRNGPSQIVLIDAFTGAARVVTSSDRGRDVTPTWTPDGRRIVFSSDRNGGPFNVYSVEVQPAAQGTPVAGQPQQLTDLRGGATYPAVSPDGSQLAYVGYTPAGYDVFALPFPENRPGPFSGSDPFSRPEHGAPTENGPGPFSEAYRPWRTLLPRYWIPAFESEDSQVKLGAATSGSDVLGRHLYDVTFLYRVAGEAGAPGSRRYDWSADYAYDRWWPTFFVGASDATHFLAFIGTGPGTVAPADQRDQEINAGVLLPDFHVGHQQSWTFSFDAQRRTLRVGSAADTFVRNNVRGAWLFNSAKRYGYSISAEQGVTAGIAGEVIRPAFGADTTADDIAGDVRSYLRLGGRHRILAVRTAAGVSRGGRGRRLFFLGGPGPNASPADLGSDALSVLRGFDPDFRFVGTRVMIASVEYRFPIVRVERGVGTLPAFLRALHGVVFADFGKAWFDRAVDPRAPGFSDRGFSRGIGVELGADLRLGYALPLTAMAGVAWPHDPQQPGGGLPATFYFRLGHAF